jgi:hypothetical protein
MLADRRCAETTIPYDPGIALPRPDSSSTVTLEELSWLAGFVDGEGAIFIQTARRPGRRIRFKCEVAIANTDLANVEHVRQIVASLTGDAPKATESNVSRGYRPCYSVRLQGQLRVALVLRALLPFLVGKKRRAELVLEFIASAPRSVLLGRSDERVRTSDDHRWAPGYGPRHYEIVSEVRRLNRRYGRGEWAAVHKPSGREA